MAQAAVEILLLVIMGDRNTQAAFKAERDADGLFQGGFGDGVTTIGWQDWADYNGNYPLVPTSVGLEMGDGKGIVSYSLPASESAENQEIPYKTFNVPVFFGLVHAGYGHLWRWVRGLIISQEAGVKTEVYVAQSMAAAFDPNSVAGLKKVAECPQKEGYIKRKSFEGLCAMPTEVGGSSATYFADYFYTNGATQTGLRVRAAGGYACNGADAGAFCVNAYYAASFASANYSSPLCFFAEDPDGYRSLYKQSNVDHVIQWLQFFCGQLCELFQSRRKGYKNHIVTNVRKYINEHVSERLSLNEVAAVFGISPNYLSQLFSKYNDTGFSEYINICKITEAKRLLEEENMKVYEAAEALGFESAFYFSKVFKRVEGVSPTEYVNNKFS